MAISTRQAGGEERIHHASTPNEGRGHKKLAPMRPALTPMVDVTFQLLLFFLLTCEFRESEGQIPGTLPAGTVQAPVAPPPSPDAIQVRLWPSLTRASANYERTGVAAVMTSPEELFQHLRDRQSRLQTRDVPVMVLPARDVPWRFVVEALNQAVRAEFTQVGFSKQI